MLCDACPCSRSTVRSDCGCCPDTVVVADSAATAAPAYERTDHGTLYNSNYTGVHGRTNCLRRKAVAAAGTEAGDRDVQEYRRRRQPSTLLFVLALRQVDFNVGDLPCSRVDLLYRQKLMHSQHRLAQRINEELKPR